MTRPLSMTAFGRGDHDDGQRLWTVEVKTVNHRFLDLKIRLPRPYAALEEKVKKEAGAVLGRGHVEISVSVAGARADATRLAANLPLARDYFDCLQAINTHLGLDRPVSLDHVLSCRDLIAPMETDDDCDAAWAAMRQALLQALERTTAMRQREGQSLKAELLARLDSFAATVGEIEAAVPGLVERRGQALKERLTKLLAEVALDPQRLAQEVAILADRSDITEELVRLRSHLRQFTQFLDENEPAGRRLDFLLQEFMREINTMTSKVADIDITHKAVHLKNEAEKMREQVQNLE